MAKLLYLFTFTVLAVHAQENALRNLSPSLRECYENKYLLERDNRLPHTLETFLAILRKIENAPDLNMDLRSLSVALLHRFRQDGIAQNPSVPSQDGITPYAPNTYHFFRFAQTLRLIPGNAVTFPNNSITDVERCTLHFMLSSSVEVYQRGDETKVCRFANAYRYPRDVKDNDNVNTESTVGDVETLTSDEIWGAVSLGLVLAGIAAATQPETAMLYDLQPDIGFDLAKSLKELEVYLAHKLDNDRSRGVGGARSDVVLIIPHTSDISKNDKDYCLQTILRMREHVPDTTLFIATHRSKDTWSELVKDQATDLFSISVGDTEEALEPITNIVSRIERVPKRLINTQCGSDYIPIGSSNSYDDYVVPNGVNFYRLHPNYFFNGENTATIKIQGASTDSLTVCSSREELHVNATGVSKSCTSITHDVHSITVSCADASFIHQCPPLYISIASNSSSTSYQCTDRRVCRYPNLIKYTISYENVLCTSDATKVALHSFILMIVLVFFTLQ